MPESGRSMKPGTVGVLLVTTALLVSCDAITGPGSSDGMEVRPALNFLVPDATDPSLGGGLTLEAVVSAEHTPGLHDVIPVVVEAAAGDRERIGLRRMWDDDDRGLHFIAISLGAGATVESPELLSRLREIGAVYRLHYPRYPGTGWGLLLGIGPSGGEGGGRRGDRRPWRIRPWPCPTRG